MKNFAMLAGSAIGFLATAIPMLFVVTARETKLQRALENQRGVAIPLLELPHNTVVTMRSTEGAGTNEGYIHIVALEDVSENSIRAVLWPERELPKQFWVITRPGHRHPQMEAHFPSPDRNMKPSWPPAPTPVQK